MNFQYYCPECKNELVEIKKELTCSSCQNQYIYKNNYVVFKNNNLLKKSDEDKKIKILLKKIKIKNFEDGVNEFLKLNNEFEYKLKNTQYDKSIDTIFHSIGNNNLRCLDIKSELGNRSEILSKIFKQVYSIECNEDYVEVQKKRFTERKCNNITISNSDTLKLPFKDNFFDLILCNGILDNTKKISNENDQYKIQEQLIKELKRVTSEKGTIIFGVNNTNINTKFKKVLKNSKCLKQNFSDYISILENNELIVNPLWALPSYDQPFYSGEINNNISLKSFFRNISIFMSSFRGGKRQNRIKEFMLLFFKKINYPFIRNMLEIFSPSFVFCCSKNENLDSIVNLIKKETGYENILRMSRHEKILFMLLNMKGEIEKVVFIKRYGYNLTNKIKKYERKFPNLDEPKEGIWITDWIEGEPINPNNQQEVNLMIKWLIDFQKNKKIEIMNKKYVDKEIEQMKNDLKELGYQDYTKYDNLFKKYEKFIEKNKVYLSPVHGDFWFPNCLFNSKNNEVNVIDWTTYSQKGNPYEDFFWFLCNLMGMTSKEPLLEFKNSLDGRGKMNKSISYLKSEINSYFGFKVDFILLLQIHLIKWMIIQKQIGVRMELNSRPDQNSLQQKMLKILSNY
jgi:ubiquinone/menaquinone biosynthesis C-methylase UbiE